MNNKIQELLNWLIEQRVNTQENRTRLRKEYDRLFDNGELTRQDVEDCYEDDVRLKTQDLILAQVIDKVNSLIESGEDEDGFDCDIWDEDEPDIKNLFEEEE